MDTNEIDKTPPRLDLPESNCFINGFVYNGLLLSARPAPILTISVIAEANTTITAVDGTW